MFLYEFGREMFLEKRPSRFNLSMAVTPKWFRNDFMYIVAKKMIKRSNFSYTGYHRNSSQKLV